MRGAGVLVALGTPIALWGQVTGDEEFTREPPEKIVTAEACGECHISEFEVWKKTPHATGFKTLHRTEAAEAIAQKMGFRLMKRDSLCLQCHYTPEVRNDQLRAVSGVSCESCHGAGRDWIDLHNDYGSGFDHATEPAEHRLERIAASRAAGMRRPSDLYGVATSCMGCHTVPNEKLVNIGGHTTGSSGFELVEWSQGDIRHNFLQSFLTGDGTENREHTAPEKRPMYVLGRLVELEYALRAAAEASEPGTYARAVGRRVKTSTLELRKIGQIAEIPEIGAAVAVVRGVQVVPGNGTALRAAADELGAIARRFADDREPAVQLASLDPLIRGEAIALPEPEVQVAAATTSGEGDPGTVATATSDPGDGSGGATSTTATANTVTVNPGRPVVGEARRTIRPSARHRTLGPGACSGCHGEANDWWAGDAHYRSAEPFFSRSPEAVRIATLYGVPLNRMVTGTALCMNCHGTVVSGSESFEVFDGASCESCHGPAADYIEAHKEGDKALGTARPGYRNALRLGMTELQNLTTRAETCTSCHYITDRRLLSSGHPSGEGFDYVAAMNKIRHWPDPAGAGTIRPAFNSVLAKRGPVPEVPLGELPETVLAEATAAAASTVNSRPTGGSWNRPRPAGPAARGATVVPPITSRSRAPGTPVELPPFPTIDASTTIEDTLLLIKQRLELVYDAVRPQ
ncbi:MAG: multiheme c-type cytochrome [Acidobacteriota bacterium]